MLFHYSTVGSTAATSTYVIRQDRLQFALLRY